MSTPILALLAVVWAVAVVPGMLRGHRVRSSQHSIAAFTRNMSLIAPERPVPGRQLMVLDDADSVSGPSRRARMVHRRRQVAVQLGAGLAALGCLAVLLGGVLWVAFAASGAAFAAFLLAVRELQRRDRERRRKVRPLRAAPNLGQPRPHGAFSSTRRRAS